MIKQKINLCRFSIVLSGFLLIYVFADLVLNGFYAEQMVKLDNKVFIIKTLGLALLFLVVSLVYTYLKTSRKNYIEKQVKLKTEKILNDESKKVDIKLDPLTQCYSKKHFEERFDEEYRRAIREKQQLSLLIVNIDEFKAYNDIYGRNEGDECIKLVANILVSQCNRPCDLVSRFGNDEFYILLPNTTEAKVVSQRCIDAVKSLKIPHDNSIASNVLTISIGVATVIPDAVSMKQRLIEEAKTSLAFAKKSGRNRVH